MSENMQSGGDPGATFLSELRGASPAGESDPAPETSAPITDLSGLKPARRVSLTNIMLALVLVISAGSLLLMRKQGKGAGMTFQVPKVDYELEKAPGVDASQERVLAELARTELGAWVPAEKIPKNPFQLESHSPHPDVPDTDLDRRRRAEQDRLEQERRRQDIQARLSSLELNSIMGGSVPLAHISGKMARLGDTVGDYFVVKAINADERTVELTADGASYTLRMNQNNDGPRRPGMPRR